MKSITEVHEALQKAFEGLNDGKLDPKTAGELHNNVGKQIGLVKLQLEYSTLRKEKPKINFLD